MMPAIEKMTPDAAAAGKMLAAVAGTKGYVTDAGADGHAQAAYAVYALASAIETAAGKDQGVVDELVGALFPDPSAPTPAADFDAALADLAGKLPK